MFFQETTPDTSGYMIAGFAVTFLVMAIYVASIYLRTRNLNQDRAILEEMDRPAPPVQVQSSSQGRSKKSPAKASVNKSAKTVTKKSRQK